MVSDASHQVFSERIASAAAMATAMLVHGSSSRSSSTPVQADIPLVDTGSLKLLLTLCNAYPPGGSCRSFTQPFALEESIQHCSSFRAML